MLSYTFHRRQLIIIAVICSDPRSDNCSTNNKQTTFHESMPTPHTFSVLSGRCSLSSREKAAGARTSVHRSCARCERVQEGRAVLFSLTHSPTGPFPSPCSPGNRRPPRTEPTDGTGTGSCRARERRGSPAKVAEVDRRECERLGTETESQAAALLPASLGGSQGEDMLRGRGRRREEEGGVKEGGRTEGSLRSNQTSSGGQSLKI